MEPHPLRSCTRSEAKGVLALLQGLIVQNADRQLETFRGIVFVECFD